MSATLPLDPRAPNFTRSEAARGVVMSEAQHQNAARLAVDVLQPARNVLGELGVSSWCRTPTHNAEVGGAASSLHLSCAGADVTPARVTSKDLATWYYLHAEIPVGEVIWYTNSSHLHISRAPNGGTRQFLRATKGVDGSERAWQPTREDVAALFGKIGGRAPDETFTPRHPAQVAMDQAREGSGGGAGGIVLVGALGGRGALFRSRRGKSGPAKKKKKK
jgi:hypothetical protein